MILPLTDEEKKSRVQGRKEIESLLDQAWHRLNKLIREIEAHDGNLVSEESRYLVEIRTELNELNHKLSRYRKAGPYC
jgi:nuclear transport factor 2 (NTF2) superfamily protein